MKKNKEFYLVEKKSQDLILKITFIRKMSDKEMKRILTKTPLAYWKEVETE